ncbi:MAG: type III ribulose-bisphosphate carboxylase [Candidatus Aenigmarchaeota archaeon]|nr:type III ribulose-bisphosphate carboxylase [Candidatus Aenigmarchaeota archaeon]
MNELVAKYYFEANGVSATQAVRQIMAESSIGTWTELQTLDTRMQKRLGPRALKYSKTTGTVEIAYPIDLFEPRNIPQLLSGLAGNIFGMKIVKNLRLLDIKFPKKYVKNFKGPKFGFHGVRKILGIKKRPVLGTIIKPKVGLSPIEFANVAYKAYSGGLDFVKDDENLTSLRFCKFEDRVIKMLDVVDRIKEEQGRNVLYAANVTAPTRIMLKRADFVYAHGGRCIMIDILTAGFSALQELRSQNYKMVIHAHRAGHASVTRNKKHGISMYLIAKLSRLIGVDQLHIGTAVGKMEGQVKEVLAIKDIIQKDHVRVKGYLSQDWYKIYPVFAVASGGLHPRLVPEVIKIMGKDIVIQAGGGVHGHPGGTKAGAKAMKQALDAAMDGVPLKIYAKTHKELRDALRRWP